MFKVDKKMENVIIILLVGVIVTLVVRYIYKAKKSGKKCIGCPGGCSKEDCSSCKLNNNQDK